MRFILTLVASLALVACGGSGGNDNANANDNGNPNTPTNPSSQAALTSATYVAVAQTVLATNAYLLDSTGLFLGVEVQEVSDPNVLVAFAQDRMNKLARRTPTPAQAVGVLQIDEEFCGDGRNGSGKIVVEYNDANNNDIQDRGDSVAFKLENCAFGSAVLNGQVKMTIDKATGDIDSYPHTIAATIAYTDLMATAAGVSTTGSGTMSLSVKSQSESLRDINLHAPAYSLTTVVGGQTSKQTLKNYNVALTMRESGRQIIATSSINGTLLDSNFGNQPLNIKTTQPFVRMSDQPSIEQGEIVITDHTKAKVRAKVANATTVTIELDADGNGTYETSVNKLWSEML